MLRMRNRDKVVRLSNAVLDVSELRPDLRIPERAPDGFPEAAMVDAKRLADPGLVEDGDQSRSFGV